MLTILLLAASTTTPWQIADLPAPDRVTLTRGADRLTLGLAGIEPPQVRTAAEQRWFDTHHALALPRWRGLSVVAITRAPDGVALVLDDGTDLAVELVRAGLGLSSSSRPALAAAEREARREQRGIWNPSGWTERRDLARLPVEIREPVPETPRHVGLAEQLASRPLRPWDERREAFDAAMRVMTAAESDDPPAPVPESNQDE